ncbi:MAG: methionyl-tRNA formyltransferase [Bacteroidota bacterium]
MRIIFLGTPTFAVPSLKILVDNGYDIAAVITAPDKPAGRGQKLQISEIKKYALENGLNILQPEKLKDEAFLNNVKELHADLQIVVAFRMMPDALWNMPKHGTINLHGSLLPQYRGAAPIQRAVMNGEKVTGVTTFFLKHEIDTGNIIFREEVIIGDDENAGELHDRMMHVGAELILKTVKAVENNSIELKEQSSFVKAGEVLHHAPKIFRDDCRMDFSKSVKHLYNQVRGLAPFPGAFFEIKNENGEPTLIKVFKAEIEEKSVFMTHHLVTDHKTFIRISAADGILSLLEIQWPGKKRMSVQEFLRGHSIDENATIL